MGNERKSNHKDRERKKHEDRENKKHVEDREDKKHFEVKEKVFTDSMKSLVVKQLHLMSDIAGIQDQVVNIIQSYEARNQWEKTQGVQHFFSPHFFVMHRETRTFLCLFVFLALQLFLQLLFQGHFRHLAPHLPETLQSYLK